MEFDYLVFLIFTRIWSGLNCDRWTNFSMNDLAFFSVHGKTLFMGIHLATFALILLWRFLEIFRSYLFVFYVSVSIYVYYNHFYIYIDSHTFYNGISTRFYSIFRSSFLLIFDEHKNRVIQTYKKMEKNYSVIFFFKK